MSKRKEKVPVCLPDELFNVKPIYDKNHKEEDDERDPRSFKRNCRISVIGKTGSGKSQAVSNIIVNGIGPSFDDLFLCLANPDQDVYKGLTERLEELDEDGLLTVKVVDDVEKLPGLKEFKKKFHSLILFDDMQTKDSKVQAKISDYFIAGRTRNVSSIYIAQNLSKGLPTSIRRNSNYFLIFGGQSPSDLELFYHSISLGGITKQEFFNLYHKATNEPHSFLLIDTTDECEENKRFRKNLNEYLQLE